MPLQALHKEDGEPALILYGQVGGVFRIETRPTLDRPVPWQPFREGTLTNLYQEIDLAPDPRGTRFLRAVRQ